MNKLSHHDIKSGAADGVYMYVCFSTYSFSVIVLLLVKTHLTAKINSFKNILTA